MTNIAPNDPAGQVSGEHVPSLAAADGTFSNPTTDRSRQYPPRWKRPIVGAGLLPDDTEVLPQVRPWAQRLLWLATPLELTYAVLEHGKPYPIPKGMTVEVWFDAKTPPRPSRHKWTIERTISRDEVIRRSPFPLPEQQGKRRKPETYITIHHLYRARIHVEGSPAWVVAWWEPSTPGDGAHMATALHGSDRCATTAQAIETLRAAQEWLRGIATRAGRRKNQKTTLTPEQVAEITAYVKQRRAAGGLWRNIIAELKHRYPEDVYDHRWNDQTLRRWI